MSRKGRPRRYGVSRDQQRIRSAEKDLAFALVRLHESDYVGAYMNTAVALVHLGYALTPAEFDKILEALGEQRKLSANPGWPSIPDLE